MLETALNTACNYRVIEKFLRNGTRRSIFNLLARILYNTANVIYPVFRGSSGSAFNPVLEMQ
jgi:hypothetical protein